MSRPGNQAVALPCPACGQLGVEGLRVHRFALYLEPAHQGQSMVSEVAVPLGRDENRLQFACRACGAQWKRIKDFEAAMAASGRPIFSLF